MCSCMQGVIGMWKCPLQRGSLFQVVGVKIVFRSVSVASLKSCDYRVRAAATEKKAESNGRASIRVAEVSPSAQLDFVISSSSSALHPSLAPFTPLPFWTRSRFSQTPSTKLTHDAGRDQKYEEGGGPSSVDGQGVPQRQQRTTQLRFNFQGTKQDNQEAKGVRKCSKVRKCNH